jgi:hypothetical protein
LGRLPGERVEVGRGEDLREPVIDLAEHVGFAQVDVLGVAGSPRPRRTLIQAVAASCLRCCAASAAARPG